MKRSAAEIDMRERANGQLASALGERRLHLAALNAVVSQSDVGLSCGLVSRAGGPPVLFVVSHTDRFRTLDVDCERVDGVWWFVRTDSGERLMRVDEVESAAPVLAGLLGCGSGLEARA